MTSTRAATALGARVRLAHADAWQVEGRARLPHGGGVHAVRGARLMASGLPTPKWNNADIEALDVDLQALVAWYAARDVRWGVRLPAEWDVPIGQLLFTKRCFGLPLTATLPPPSAAGIQVQRAGVADFDTYVATDGRGRPPVQRVRGDPCGMARRRIAVLDNEPSYLDVIQDLLQDEGFEVVTLADLRAGYALCSSSIRTSSSWTSSSSASRSACAVLQADGCLRQRGLVEALHLARARRS